MAEHVCLQYSNEKKLPLAILRPSIVAPTEVEPERGRVDSLTGTLALMVDFSDFLYNPEFNSHNFSFTNSLHSHQDYAELFILLISLD